MSYILDALRKADAERERERGAVPSLYAPAAPEAGVDREGRDAGRGSAHRSPLRWVVLGLLLLLGASLFWQWLGAEEQPPVVVHMPAPSPIPEPAVEPAAPVAEPPPEALVVAEAQPVAPDPLPPAAPPPTAPTPRSPAAPIRTPAPPAAPAVVALPQLHELPENLRRNVPPMQVGGAMYSEDPGKRMVVLNGQVFHEGDRPAPDLTLEQIRLKSAVFSLPGGQRFVLNF